MRKKEHDEKGQQDHLPVPVSLAAEWGIPCMAFTVCVVGRIDIVWFKGEDVVQGGWEFRPHFYSTENFFVGQLNPPNPFTPYLPYNCVHNTVCASGFLMLMSTASSHGALPVGL